MVVKQVVLRLKPYLEVFHLSKLPVQGVQIQIQMYLEEGGNRGGKSPFSLLSEPISPFSLLF